MKTTPLLPSLALLALGTSFVTAADWPIWRGPTYDGISTEKDWNLSAEPKTLWEPPPRGVENST